VTGGGDLWDASPKAKRIGEAIKALRSQEPTTLGAIESVDYMINRIKERGPKHFERFDNRTSLLLRRDIGLHEAMGQSMAYEDVLGGYGEPAGLEALPEPMRKGYHEGRRQAVQDLK
jgi:hypothetical protein